MVLNMLTILNILLILGFPEVREQLNFLAILSI